MSTVYAKGERGTGGNWDQWRNSSQISCLPLIPLYISAGFKVWAKDPRGLLRPFQRDLQGQIYFHNTTTTVICLFCSHPLMMYGAIFPRLLSQTLKEYAKMQNHTTLLTVSFILEDTIVFHKNITYTNM